MSEANEIKRDGAKPTKNSGRGTEKGDARFPSEGTTCFTIDFKEYEKSYSVSKAGLAKINSDALKNGDESGIIKVILGSGEEKVRCFIIEESIGHEMMKLYYERYYT